MLRSLRENALAPRFPEPEAVRAALLTIIRFLLTAALAGAAAERFGRRLPVLIASMALGVLLCYAFGTAWFVLVYSRGSGAVGVGTALAWCVLPYLLPDAVKIALAAVLARRLYPLLKKEVAG